MSLLLGSTAPNFTIDSTAGQINFHDWAGDSWVFFFSHPADFTPVCTTEMGRTAQLAKEFEARNVKPLGLSTDTVEEHVKWIEDVNDTQNCDLQFPIVADADHKVAELYEMIHAGESETAAVRSVFIIDPNKKIRLILTYPASTGRNFDEILRALDSLQLTDNYSVATPVNWKQGEDVIIVLSLKDPAVLKEKFPKGYTEIRPYLRITPQPDR